MPFRPVGADHAIVSNSFTIGLGSPLSREALAALKTKRNTWADALPAIREMQSLEFQVQLDGAGQIRQSPTIEFAFLRPDGAPTWVMRIDQSDILVECALYTRWNQVWSQAFELLAQALDSLVDARPKSFTMQVLDRFESDRASDKASEIFASGAPLDPRVRDIQSLWHQHIGWLESATDGELLQNINVDVLPNGAVEGPVGKVVNLLHMQRLTFKTPSQFSEGKNAISELSRIANGMHLNNKELLRSILSEEMRRLVQLDGKS